MKKIGLGIAILLFAVVFSLCSSGKDFFAVGIGMAGLFFAVLGYVEHP